MPCTSLLGTVELWIPTEIHVLVSFARGKFYVLSTWGHLGQGAEASQWVKLCRSFDGRCGVFSCSCSLSFVEIEERQRRDQVGETPARSLASARQNGEMVVQGAGSVARGDQPLFWTRAKSSESDGIVVVTAWVFSKPRQLEHYSRFYASSNWDSLICHPKVFNLFVSIPDFTCSIFFDFFVQYASIN